MVSLPVWQPTAEELDWCSRLLACLLGRRRRMGCTLYVRRLLRRPYRLHVDAGKRRRNKRNAPAKRRCLRKTRLSRRSLPFPRFIRKGITHMPLALFTETTIVLTLLGGVLLSVLHARTTHGNQIELGNRIDGYFASIERLLRLVQSRHDAEDIGERFDVEKRKPINVPDPITARQSMLRKSGYVDWNEHGENIGDE